MAMTMAMTAATLRGMEVWPPHIPDLKPIEQVVILGDKVQEKKPLILQELEEILQESGKKLVFGISRISLIVCLGELQLLLPSRAGTHNTNICKDFIKILYKTSIFVA